MDGVANVFFDLDGTLVDSAPGIIASMREVLVDYRLRPSDDDLRHVIGPPLDVSLRVLGVPETLVAEAVERYREVYAAWGLEMVSLYPGIADLVASLVSAGFTLAVATAKREDFARRIVRLVGLDDAFEGVVGAPLAGVGPHKTVILGDALVRYPSQGSAWMIGDRRDDMEAALEHCVGALGITWGYGSPDELRAAGASALFDEPAQVFAMLNDTTNLP